MTDNYLVKSGDKVSIDFQGRIKGESSDILSTKETGPVSFSVGDQSIFEKIELAVIGMKVGDSKEVELAPKEAYGDINDELIVEAPKDKLPADIQVGAVLQNSEDDQEEWLVTAIEGDTVVLDGNHPLAGQTVVFNITLMNVESGNH